MTDRAKRTLRDLVCLVALLVALVVSLPAAAGEGMWMPAQLPELAAELEATGLELDPQVLADPEQAPLAAIISLAGCSASFISADGLAATNHHCAVDAIQHNSTPERNLFETGFVARTRDEEPWTGHGSRIYVTESLTDVTERIMAGVEEGMDDQARFDAIDRAQKELVAECESEPGNYCQVATFYGGGEYRLIQQFEIQDVRLVFAPPSAIGDFGGEIDNFEWPRHSGDVALFRAYVGPDGEPAPYDPENVPYQPEHYLTVSPEGVNPGDYVMVAGYPWSTYRHRTARELQVWGEVITPWEIDLMNRIIATIDPIMEADEDAKVKLTPWHAGLSNYLKYNQGIVDGLRGSGIVEGALERAEALRSWLAEQGEEAAEWREKVAELDAVIDERFSTIQRDSILSWMYWSVDMLNAADKLFTLAVEREKPDEERLADYQERNWPDMRESLEGLDSTFVEASDRAMLAFFFEEAQQLPEDQRIAAVDELLARYADHDDGAAVAAANDLYDRLTIGDAESRLALFDASAEDLRASEDALVQLAIALYPLRDEVRTASQRRDGAYSRLRPAYLAALQAFDPSPLYPDANATLRVTFGTVQGYEPRDAVIYTPQTTLQGIVEKHTGEAPFDAPDELLAAIASGEYGPYFHEPLGSVPVDFLANVDITGGNSGSATMNARGELVGLLFDGNYESMPADWIYNPATTRSIHVDIRYLLWMLDRVYGADHLLEEMGVTPAL